LALVLLRNSDHDPIFSPHLRVSLDSVFFPFPIRKSSHPCRSVSGRGPFTASLTFHFYSLSSIVSLFFVFSLPGLVLLRGAVPTCPFPPDWFKLLAFQASPYFPQGPRVNYSFVHSFLVSLSRAALLVLVWCSPHSSCTIAESHLATGFFFFFVSLYRMRFLPFFLFFQFFTLPHFPRPVARR